MPRVTGYLAKPTTPQRKTTTYDAWQPASLLVGLYGTNGNRPCVKYGKTSGLERSTARVHGSASRLSDRSFETFMHKNRIDPRPNCKPRRASGYG